MCKDMTIAEAKEKVAAGDETLMKNFYTLVLKFLVRKCTSEFKQTRPINVTLGEVRLLYFTK